MLTFKLKYSCGSVDEGTSVRVGFTLEEVIDTTAGVQTPRNGKLTIVGRGGGGGGGGAKVDCLKKKKKDRKEGKQRRRKERSRSRVKRNKVNPSQVHQERASPANVCAGTANTFLPPPPPPHTPTHPHTPPHPPNPVDGRDRTWRGRAIMAAKCTVRIWPHLALYIREF